MPLLLAFAPPTAAQGDAHVVKGSTKWTWQRATASIREPRYQDLLGRVDTVWAFLWRGLGGGKGLTGGSLVMLM